MLAFGRKTLKTVARYASTNWRLCLVVLAVALGILAGALASGRIKFPIHW